MHPNSGHFMAFARKRFVTRMLIPMLLFGGLSTGMPDCSCGQEHPPFRIAGDTRQWHTITITMHGPQASETGTPNPFLDYRMTAVLTHRESGEVVTVPGYFAADGNASDTSATEGNIWRAHFCPHLEGEWLYRVSIVAGTDIAIRPDDIGDFIENFAGVTGAFTVRPTDKTGVDFRALGRLVYTGDRYLRCARTGQDFFKAGPDSPETLLAYTDFDGTVGGKPEKAPLKTWQPHEQDFREGDPTWKDGKGKGLIGAVNYLADKGLNAVSFLTYNAGGDGDNVWPFVERDNRTRYDCSKLDQWGIVFQHAQQRGIMLHFKLQETENDDLNGKQDSPVKTALDDGELGVQRKLYLRELVARFGHLPGLEWNLGEENTQSAEMQMEMAAWLKKIDPYDHPVVLHTYPNKQQEVYEKLLGTETLAGVSLQNPWQQTHRKTAEWIQKSTASGHTWVVANDEQNPADAGVPADPGFEDFSGTVEMKNGTTYDMHDIRRDVLWGNLMAGGAGVNYYFGYRLPQNDLNCENFRSREKSLEYCGHAVKLIQRSRMPLRSMIQSDQLVGNPDSQPGPWCLAAPNHLFLVYSPDGESLTLDLTTCDGRFQVSSFNPRTGEYLRSPKHIFAAPCSVDLGRPADEPAGDDWVFIVHRPVVQRAGSENGEE